MKRESAERIKNSQGILKAKDKWRNRIFYEWMADLGKETKRRVTIEIRAVKSGGLEEAWFSTA